MPLITIPDIEFDFEEQRQKRTVDEHVQPFPKRFCQKWGRRPAWVGLDKNIAQESMDNGLDTLSYVFVNLRSLGARAIPAISVHADKNTLTAVSSITRQDRLGVGVCIGLEDLMKRNLNANLISLVSTLGLSFSQTDLLLDLGAPNFCPYSNFSAALTRALSKVKVLKGHRRLVLIGSAMPESVGALAKGMSEIPRHDWLFYRTALKEMDTRFPQPIFGDYTVVHPRFRAVDMRLYKPAGKLFYTVKDKWIVCKGGAFQSNRAQMHDHCQSIVGNGLFKGPMYSKGDEYIAKCAARVEGPSNATTWKQVAINHHISHVVIDDLATLGGQP